MSVACRLSPQRRKSVCQSATSEARTARIAPPGRPARDTVAGPRPADASWTYNAQTLGQLRADTPRIPGGRSLQRRVRPAAQARRELKMPSSNFCSIPRSVVIQVQRSAISATRRQVPWSARERAGCARTRWGGGRGGLGLPLSTTPKKSEGVDLSRRRTIGAAP
jgi:hypothetical protein